MLMMQETNSQRKTHTGHVRVTQGKCRQDIVVCGLHLNAVEPEVIGLFLVAAGLQFEHCSSICEAVVTET